MKAKRTFWASLLGVAMVTPAMAQPSAADADENGYYNGIERTTVPQITEDEGFAINLDGVADEDVWSRTQALECTKTLANWNTTPVENTWGYACTFKLLYDARTLYVFFDITDNTPESDTTCIQFNEEIAQQIVHFVKRIDRSRELFINCAAGISRSGAVGEVLNDYFNSFLEDNEPDRRYFIRSNPQINGNPLVRRLLRQALFGGENPFSALSGLPPRK